MYCGNTSPINRIYPLWGGVGVVHIWSLQKHLNHMWEGTLADVGLAITTTRSSPWLVLPTLGDEPINREGLAPQSR